MLDFIHEARSEQTENILFYCVFFLSENQTIFSMTSYKESVQPLVICMMAFYLLVANVLLLNILIAVFKYVMLFARYMLAEMAFLKKVFSRGFVQYYIKLLLNLQKQSPSSKTVFVKSQ